MDTSSSSMEIHDCEEIKWTEVENALTDLNLKWVTMGDYIVVMKNKCDVSIGGEPYLVLQLWFNVKSGKIIKRIWDQTVSSGKVSGVSQFVEACSSHFKGRPCIGCPVPSNEISWENYLISQTPIPRKISRACRKVLAPGTDKEVKSCPDCLTLSDSKNSEIGPHDIGHRGNDGTNEENCLKGVVQVANQAIYMQEITKKYPHILKAGRQFRIKIKTEGSKGCLQERVLLVDPTQTLQQGGIVQTLSENNLINDVETNVQEHEEKRVNSISGKVVLKSEQEYSSTERSLKDEEKTIEQHEENGYETNDGKSDPVGVPENTQIADTCQDVIDHEVMSNKQTILQDENHITSTPFHDPKPNIVNDVKKYKCNICSYSTKYHLVLQRHLQKGHTNKCPNCSFETNRESLLLKHMKNEHGTDKNGSKVHQSFSCEACGKICPSRLSLQIHRSKEHEEFTFHKECDICNKKITFRLFRRHRIKMHGITGTYEVQCYWCKKPYSTETFMDHAKKKHFYGSFSCEKCSFSGHIARDLIDHIKENHADITSAKCPCCKKDHPVDNLEGEYKNCIKEFFREDRMCPSCGKTFTARKHFKRHLQFNCAQQPSEELWCDKCGKKFSSPLSLRDHIKVAHENFVFKCESCPMTFKSRCKMHHHKLIAHSTDKKYQCRFCGQRLGSLPQKRSHERKHQEPTFQCNFCEKKLSTQKGLEWHERQHTGEKPFKCPLCENAFASLGGLQQHKRGVHKIEGPRGSKPGWDGYKKKSKAKGQFLPPE